MSYVTVLSLITCAFLNSIGGANEEISKRLLDRSVTKRSNSYKLICDLLDLLEKEMRETENLMKKNIATIAMLKKMKMEVDVTKQMVIKYKKTSSKQLTDIQTTVNSILNKPGFSRHKNNHTVGFTAIICCNRFKDSEIMSFTNVRTMYGNDYNTKIFVCSKPGMYCFHLMVMPKKGFAYIVKNGKKIVHSSGRSSASGYESTSAGLVVRLAVGDKMWVQSSGKSYFDGGSQFSGMLIAE